MVCIEVSDVSKRYGQVVALAGVDITLDSGVTVVLGRNGAGKSTLSRVVAGLELPDEGVVSRDGIDLRNKSQLKTHKASTGWLPQAFRANGSMAVRDYVQYAGWLKGLSGSALREQVEEALHACDLQLIADRRLVQLSGGMLRRAGVAQAIVARPDLLVLDEPTVGLDPEQRGNFHQLVRGLADSRTVLLSTHLLEDALATASRVVVLEAGQIPFDGSLGQLQARGKGTDAAEQLRSGFLAVTIQAAMGDRGEN